MNPTAEHILLASVAQLGLRLGNDFGMDASIHGTLTPASISQLALTIERDLADLGSSTEGLTSALLAAKTYRCLLGCIESRIPVTK